jgi:deoxyadenosine/deoxycytidine kinase
MIQHMSFQYIAIEGPIGVGKTLLADRFALRLDATKVLEETENPFLADFYAGDPARRCSRSCSTCSIDTGSS